MRWLGREYTLWIAVVAALINFLVGFKLKHLSAEQAAVIITAVNAVAAAIAAWRTRPMAPQIFTYAVASVAALLSAYELNLTQEMVTQLQLLVLGIMALITRGEVSPKEDAHETGVLGNKVTTDN